jgi:hypothetical protein
MILILIGTILTPKTTTSSVPNYRLFFAEYICLLDLSSYEQNITFNVATENKDEGAVK